MVSAVVVTEERRQLRASVRRALEERANPRQHLERPGERTDKGLWELLARDMGLVGLLDPGGVAPGPAFAELGVVFEELGASLAPVPMLATVALAGMTTVAAPSNDASSELLTRLSGGEATATVALHDVAAVWRGEGTTVRCSTRSSPTVTGEAAFVVDAEAADVLLVPALRGDDTVVLAVEADQAAVTTTPQETLDLTRDVSHVAFKDAAATVMIESPDAAAVIPIALDFAIVMLSAEQVGLSRRCLEVATKYAKERVQFDRPIGSFQAIKHRLVDMLLEVELATSALHYAQDMAQAYFASPGAETAQDLRVGAGVARAMCSDTARFVTTESLHVFGGIGFTWEHDAHLYFRRARSDALLFGSPSLHRRRVAEALGVSA